MGIVYSVYSAIHSLFFELSSAFKITSMVREDLDVL